MSLSFRHAGVAFSFLLLSSFAACGDDDSAGEDLPLSPTAVPSPTASAAATEATGEASPEASPVATPDPAVALDLAASPAYVLYEVSPGDTLDSIATALGESGGAEALSELNELESDELTEGQLLAVPFVPDEGLLVPAGSLAAALGIDTGDSPLRLMTPSTGLVDGYLGRLALARVRTAGPEAVDGPGYVLEFYFTDRPALKAGEPDSEARFTGPAFTLGAGSLAPDLLAVAGEAYGAYPLEGAAYSVVTFPEANLQPAEIWEQLEPVDP